MPGPPPCSRSVSFGPTAAHAAATVKEVRGIGLMIGVELDGEAKPVIARMAERGLLGIGAGMNVIRFLPALNTTRAEVDEAVQKLKESL